MFVRFFGSTQISSRCSKFTRPEPLWPLNWIVILVSIRIGLVWLLLQRNETKETKSKHTKEYHTQFYFQLKCEPEILCTDQHTFQRAFFTLYTKIKTETNKQIEYATIKPTIKLQSSVALNLNAIFSLMKIAILDIWPNGMTSIVANGSSFHK